MSVDVGELPAAPSAGFDKRKLLIGAVVIGGGIGLVVFLMRRNAGVPTENQPQTGAPAAGALDIAYQNLATQLLGLRGDISVANADLATGQQDALSAIGSEAANRATSDQTLFGMLSQWFATSGKQLADVQSGVSSTQAQVGQIGSGIGALQSSVTGLSGEIGGVSGQVAGVSGQVGGVSGQVTGAQASLSQLSQAVGANTGQLQTIAVRQYYGVAGNGTGAGGALVRDSIMAAFDGGIGDGADAMRLMSAGPVRQVSNDRQN